MATGAGSTAHALEPRYMGTISRLSPTADDRAIEVIRSTLKQPAWTVEQALEQLREIRGSDLP